MTPCAGIAQIPTRSSSVRRVAVSAPRGARPGPRLFSPRFSGSPRPSERPLRLLLTLLRPQFGPKLSLESP